MFIEKRPVRRYQISSFLSDKEYALLNHYCNVYNCTRAYFIRELLRVFHESNSTTTYPTSEEG